MMKNTIQNRPLVSIFVPYYNDIDCIRECIESILNNSYTNFELILLNHASTDGSREIVRSYIDSRIIHIDLDKNFEAGGGILFKKGLSYAHGQYFKPFCADDTMPSDCIEQLVQFMNNNQSVDFVFTMVKHIDSSGKVLHIPKTPQLSSLQTLRILSTGKNFLCYPAVFFRTKILRHLKLDNSMIMLFDVSLWVKTLIAGNEISFTEKTHINYRIHKNQISKNCIRNQKLIEIEQKVFWRLFTEVDDIDLVKEIWPNSTLKEKLTHAKDIPFFVARELLVSNYFHSNSYEYIYNLLENDVESKRLYEIFSYDVKSFRCDVYKSISNYEKSGYKERLYNTPCKYLNFRDLAYLMMRKVVKTFKR